MIDVKQLNKLTPSVQLDIVRTMLVVARAAFDKSKDESPEVREVLADYLAHSEDLLRKASWAVK